MSIKRNNEVVAGRYEEQTISYATQSAAGIIRIASSTDIEVIPSNNTAIAPTQVLSLLGTKQDTLTAGANIQISEENVISALSTTYTAGSNIQISSEGVISATDSTYAAGNGLTLTEGTFSANVENNTSSSSTTNALSANMGRELQEQINNLKSLGRYLSGWDCTSGLPTSDPTVSPYTYKSGDYYIIGAVSGASGTNYKPNGTTYVIGIPSTTVETKSVSIGDIYMYDGSEWRARTSTQRDVSFADITGQPTDSTNLAIALNEKVTKNADITGATYPKVTYDSKGLVTSGENLAESDIPNIHLEKVSDVTATAEELNYSAGVTSAIQSQLNAKEPLANVTSKGSANTPVYFDENGVAIPISYYSGTSDRAVKDSNGETINVYYATKSELSGKQDTLTAGSSIDITGNVISFSGTIPVRISDLADDTATNPVDKADTLTDLTATAAELNYCDGVTGNIQTQLDGKQATLTAGTGITIVDNVISSSQAAPAWGNITGTLSDQSDLNTALSGKQATLTAGSNIQINDNTISATDTTYTAGANIQISDTNEISATDTTYTAGTGITIVDNVISSSQAAPAWGEITGTLSDQSDLNTALSGKQDSLTAGSNITISGGTISATDTTYTAGTNVQITDGVISATDTTYTAGSGISITNNVISSSQAAPAWGEITGTLSNQSDLSTALGAKQDTLTAGSNIQISSGTISATDTTYTAGSGISISAENVISSSQAAPAWGEITGTLSNQSDLNTALSGKQDTLTAGSNITISGGTISATDTTYTAGSGISITNNVISNTQTGATWGSITGTLSSQTDLQTALDGKQTSNLVTSISASSTDTEYPSAKCIYDLLGDIEATLETIRGV